MKNVFLGILSFASIAIIGFSSCSKSTSDPTPATSVDTLNQASHTYVGSNGVSTVWRSDTARVRSNYQVTGGSLIVRSFKGSQVSQGSLEVFLRADKFVAPFNGTYAFSISDTSENKANNSGYWVKLQDENVFSFGQAGAYTKGAFSVANYDATAGTMDITYNMKQKIGGVEFTITNGKILKLKKK